MVHIPPGRIWFALVLLVACAGEAKPPRMGGGTGDPTPEPEADAAAGKGGGGSGGSRAVDAAQSGGGGMVGADAAPVGPTDTGVDRPATVDAMAAVDAGVDATGPGPDAGGGIEQTPPQGKAAADAWLRAGHYKKWACEPMKMNPRPLGVHGPNRVCSNAILSAHTGPGPYPVGAAAVKEIFYGNRVGNYALAVKIKEGTTGAAWYWYEPGDLEGVGAGGCVGCHNKAAQNGGRDQIFIQVK